MSKHDGNREVISRADRLSHGPTGLEYWEKDFAELPFYTIIEKILETPADIMGMLIRTVIKDERQANAIILLANRFEKYHDTRHMNMLKMKLATMAAMGGRARMEALFASTRLLAPDMYRTIMGMPRSEGEEKVHRGGPDLREKREESED